MLADYTLDAICLGPMAGRRARTHSHPPVARHQSAGRPESRCAEDEYMVPEGLERELAIADARQRLRVDDSKCRIDRRRDLAQSRCKSLAVTVDFAIANATSEH